MPGPDREEVVKVEYDLHGCRDGIIFEDHEGEPWYCERVTMTRNAVVNDAKDYFQEYDLEFKITEIWMRYVDDDPNEEIEMELPTWLICAESHADAVPFWKIEVIG